MFFCHNQFIDFNSDFHNLHIVCTKNPLRINDNFFFINIHKMNLFLQCTLAFFTFSIFSIHHHNKFIYFLRFTSIILCIVTSFTGQTLPIFWAHIIPAIILFYASVSTVKHGNSLEGNSMCSKLIAFSFILLSLAEIYMTKLKTLHSFCHMFIFLPIVSLSLLAGMKHIDKKVQIFHNTSALCTIGTILLYHKHDVRDIALCWHKLIGIGLILIGLFHMINGIIELETKNPVKYLNLILTWLYSILSCFMLEMALCLYMFYDASGNVSGLHSLWHTTPDPYESICLYLSISFCLGGMLTIITIMYNEHKNNEMYRESNDMYNKLLIALKNWKKQERNNNNLKYEKNSNPHGEIRRNTTKYQHCDCDNTFKEDNI